MTKKCETENLKLGAKRTKTTSCSLRDLVKKCDLIPLQFRLFIVTTGVHSLWASNSVIFPVPFLVWIIALIRKIIYYNRESFTKQKIYSTIQVDWLNKAFARSKKLSPFKVQLSFSFGVVFSEIILKACCYGKHGILMKDLRIEGYAS